MKEVLKEKYGTILNKRIDKPYWVMMLITVLLGVLSFGLLYGFDIVNVTNDSWLYNAGGDMSGHYLGWIYYRKAPWHFPIGLQDGITYPYSFSVLYMDSIPFFALFFKVLSPVLPEVFQYFGIYGLITFVLQGVVGSNIIYSKTKDTFFGLISSPFFILSPVVLQRMYGHSALAFHPIVLLAIYVYINRDAIKEKRRDLLYWCLLLALSVSVQAYFFPMVYLFVVAFYLPEIISKKTWYKGLLKIIIPVVVTLFVMYAWGYFYGDHNYNGGGFGVFNSNLNVLLNSQGNSFLGELMGMTGYDAIWESYAYLGFGIIVMCIISIYDLFVTPSDRQTKRIFWPTVVVVTVFCVASVIPSVKFGAYTLLDIDFPENLLELFGTFRANGRFMWPVMYLILVAVLVHIFNRYKRKYFIVVFCLALQIIDLSTVYTGIVSRMDALESAEYLLKDSRWNDLSYKSEIFFMYDPVGGGPTSLTMPIGKYAADNNMIMNDFYTSRKDTTAISQDRIEEQSRIFDGNPSDDRIYVFYDLPLEYLLYDIGLNIYELDGIYIGVTDNLGKDSLSIDSGIDLLDYTSVYNEIDDSPVVTSDETEMAFFELSDDEYFSEFLSLPEGKYSFVYEGDNLDNAELSITSGSDGKSVKPDNLVEADEKISFDIEMDKSSNLNIECSNDGKGEMLLTEAKLYGEKSEKKPSEIELGELVSFVGDSYNGAPYTISGMSAPEQGFTWTNGDEVDFHFVLDPETTTVCGKIDIAGVFYEPQEVSVLVNEEEVFSDVVSEAGEIDFRFTVPSDGIINMKLLLPNSKSPKEVGESDDARDLALMIKSITFDKYELPEYDVNEPVCFMKSGYNADKIDLLGISSAEEKFSWTSAKKCHIGLNAGDEQVKKCIISYENVFNGTQRVTILVNGSEEFEGELTGQGDIEIACKPDSDGNIDICLEIPDAISPKEVGESEDARTLGVALSKIVFR